MGTYETIVTDALLVLCIVCAWQGIKAYMHAAKEQDAEPRKKCRRKAILLTAMTLMLLLCALYIIFRIEWFMFGAFLAGIAVVAYVIGTGVGANMREH